MNSRMAFFSMAVALTGIIITIFVGLLSRLTSGIIYYLLFSITVAVAFACSILAVILGSNSNKSKKPGKGIAITGIVLGSLDITYLLLLAIGTVALIVNPIKINLGPW